MSLFSYCCPCFASNTPEYTAIPDEEREESYDTSRSLNIEAVTQNSAPVSPQPEISVVTPTPPVSDNGNVFHTIPDHNQEDKREELLELTNLSSICQHPQLMQLLQ